MGKLVEGRHGQVFSVPVTQADEAVRLVLGTNKTV